MITRVEVNGFKSLDEFTLNFTKGLNILVGPNGAGKTNIIAFFEFLSHLVETDASEATSRVGGAGAVFRRTETTYQRMIKAKIYGCIELGRSARSQAERDETSTQGYCQYEYSFDLVFPDIQEGVYFETQRLRLGRASTFCPVDPDLPDSQWSVDVESVYVEGDNSKVAFKKYDETILGFPYFLPTDKKIDTTERVSQIVAALSRFLSGNTVSLAIVVQRFTPDIWPLLEDLNGGQIYNIVPSRLKIPEDSSKSPGITRDGSGLAATLYALDDRRIYGPWRHSGRNRRYADGTMQRLKQYLAIVNENISDISVENDPFDNQLRVKFILRSGDYHVTLPMSLMSDGTLKWLAIITAALTVQSIFCIEEPENYLHPHMQGQTVSILREILFDETSNRFLIMTTHSETLLNRCTPEELIIVSMKEGKTVAKRCSNASEINEEISRTGFGLGYYFVSDAIQND